MDIRLHPEITLEVMAKKYGISIQHAGRIRRGERWAAMQPIVGKPPHYMKKSGDRPYLIIGGPCRWLFTGKSFTSEFSDDAKMAIAFEDLGVAESYAQHLRDIEIDAAAIRATREQAVHLNSRPIRARQPGERIVVKRLKPSIDPLDFLP